MSASSRSGGNRRRTLEPDGSVAFIVELGETLSPEEAAVHAEAVRTIAVEG